MTQRYFKHASLALLAGLLVALSGCSSFKEPKNPPVPLVEFKETMAIKKAWSANLGDTQGFVFTPAFVSNSVIAASYDGYLVRIDNSNGREIWKIDTETPLTAGVGTDGSTIAVIGDKGVLLAYDMDGKLKWKIQTSSEVLSAPVVSDDLIVVRSIDNRIAAYEIATGKRRWQIERTLPTLILRSAIGMVALDHNLYVGLPGGKLISVAISSGSVRWEASVGDPKGATELERVADVNGIPAIYGQDICATAYQSKVSCFDIKSGVLRWSKDISTDMGVGIDERFVFAVDNKGTVNAFSRNAGLSEWKNDKLAYRKLSAPVSFGRAVVVGDFDGHIHFLSREDGSFLARTDTDGSNIVATPVVAGSNVIFQTTAGEIIALSTD